ncbi:hypothetical protein Aduo_016692 [Ancylostoma duodenale]
MIMTSTVLPILCLMDWHSPKCRLNAPPPRFAPNYDVNKARAHELARNRAKSAIRADDADVADSASLLVPELRSLEDQDDYDDGFFTPIIPSAATAPRRAVHSKGESTPAATVPVTTTVIITTTTARTTVTSTTTTPSTTTSTTTTTKKPVTTMTSTTTTAAATTTTAEPPRIIYLSDYDAPDYEVSTTDAPRRHQTPTPVTKPLAEQKPVTVLPRPYESVREAARQNPDYLGDSIWASIDLLPEPMVTGPAWRTHLTRNTTTTKSTTTTTAAMTTSRKIQKPTQPTTTPRVPFLRTTKPSSFAGWC